MGVDYDWGLGEPPNPAATKHANANIDGLRPYELPEVRELISQGWQLAPDAPMLAFLPAVWPSGLRTWIPDRATHYEQRYEKELKNRGPLRSWLVVISHESQANEEDDIDNLLARANVVGRPRGRLWLLKPPPGFVSVDDALDELGRQAAADGIATECSRSYVKNVARALHRLST